MHNSNRVSNKLNLFFDIFPSLTDEDIDILKRNSMLLNYKIHENIIKQDEKLEYIIFLIEGYAKIWQVEANRHELLAIVSGHDQLLLSLLVAEKKSPVNVMAISGCEVMRLQADVFVETCKRNGAFAQEVFHVAHYSFKNFYKNRSLKFFKKNMHARFAQVLVSLSQDTYKSLTFNITLRRDELAQLVGVSRENVIKVITDLRKDKIIEVTGKHFKILKLDDLVKIANIG